MVSPKLSKTKGKIGPDGLTKQQRWVKKNRSLVNASNARRNREKRRRMKEMRQKINSAEAPAREEHEPTCQGKCHGASASEIYKSDWFDKQLDRDLAELDALDAFEELQKEFEEVREETDDLGPALSKKWNFHYGWFSVKPFRGSDSEYDIGSRVRRLDSLMDRLKNLLETLPAGGYEWKETLEMIIWGAGASSFWNQFSVVLAEEPEE